METRKCLNCDRNLVGRIDKKFCDTQCRSQFYNRTKFHTEKYLKEINRTIRRNRKILKILCPIGKSTIRKEELIELGFNFNYFTSIFPSSGKVYYFCYEYGYTPILERSSIQKVLIIQKQLYMDKPFDPWAYLKK